MDSHGSTAHDPAPDARRLTFLFASTPITAHTLNASKLVTGLGRAGHQVLWYADSRFSAHVTDCGAEHLAPSRDSFEAALVVQGGRALDRVRSLYRDQVVGSAESQLADLERLTRDRHIDAVVSDTLIPAAGLAARGRGVPSATFGDGPLLWWDEGTPPFGAGLPLMGGRAGRHRNRHVQAAIDRWLFGPFVADLNRLRVRRGLEAAPTMRAATMSDQLHLQGCPPSFEYPRSRLPESIRFVGALGPAAPMGDPLPDRLRRNRRSRPLALVTQGTLRPDLRELVLPACAALVREGYEVVVAGTPDGPWNRWPGRVTALHRVDYPDALGESDLFVTNGGYTGVTLALAAGVPIVQAGTTEEKPDIGARIAWSGAGASLRVGHPPAWLLRRTIRRVMGSPRRRDASARLAAESRRYDAAALGARSLVELVTGTPA